MLNMNTASASASPGRSSPGPTRSAICSTGWPSRRIAMMQAKVPAVMNT